jgi:hypothetical protein
MFKFKVKERVRRPSPVNPLTRANQHAAPNERIAEFEGGLISTRWITDDAGMEIMHVTLYQLAANVAVTVEHGAEHTLVAVPVEASGVGSVAVGGHNAAPISTSVRNTGAATATGGGIANSGSMRTAR